MTHDPTPPRSNLAAHARVVIGAEGPERSVTVVCPVKERSSDIDDCADCQRLVGIVPDSLRERSHVVCRTAPPPPDMDAHQRATLAELASTPLMAIMPREVLCVRPETRLAAVVELMVTRAISGVPVVDAAGKPVGMISKSDLVRAMRDDDGEARPTTANEQDDLRSSGLPNTGFHVEGEDRTASEVMTPIAFCLPEVATIAHASALMAFEGIHRVPVVGIKQDVVGVVSSLDILRWLAERCGYLQMNRIHR